MNFSDFIARRKEQAERRRVEEFIQRYIVAPTETDRELFFSTLFERQINRLLIAQQDQGAMIIPSNDRYIAHDIYVHGAFQDATLQEVHRLLQARRSDNMPDTLIDMGANIGVICIPAIAEGYFKRAIAIEPAPATARLLRANIALYGLEGVISVFETALADGDGEVEFELSADNWGDHRVSVVSEANALGERERNKIRVPMCRFDALKCDVDPAKSLVWIDVQGYEGFVLSGANSLTSTKTPMVVEIWPYGLDRAQSYQALKAAIGCYKQFILLGEKGEAAPLSDLDNLYDALKPSMAHRDVLLL